MRTSHFDLAHDCLLRNKFGFCLLVCCFGKYPRVTCLLFNSDNTQFLLPTSEGSKMPATEGLLAGGLSMKTFLKHNSLLILTISFYNLITTLLLFLQRSLDFSIVQYLLLACSVFILRENNGTVWKSAELPFFLGAQLSPSCTALPLSLNNTSFRLFSTRRLGFICHHVNRGMRVYGDLKTPCEAFFQVQQCCS